MKKKAFLYLFLVSIFAGGCSSNKQAKDVLPFIDVSRNYPEKEISLSAIAEVTYLHLNTSRDEYLYKGTIRNVTNNTIVVYDNSSGSILFFSKEGNPKSRFNHYGQGPEEYNYVERIIYDEEKDEVYVCDNKNTILTYSSTGEYKRKIALPQNTQTYSMIDFDDKSFFVNSVASVDKHSQQNWDGVTDLIPSSYYTTFYQISKADGTVLDSLELQNNATELMFRIDKGDYRIMIEHTFYTRIIKCPDGLFLCNPEKDTIFLYAKDKSLTPVFYKTPPVRETNPKVIIDNWCETGGYRFFFVRTFHNNKLNFDFPTLYYVYDKKTNEIFRQKVILPDYKGKEFTLHPALICKTNATNGAFFELDLMELKEAYNDNRLNGKLKELVATLNELEDNNVFIIINYK